MENNILADSTTTQRIKRPKPQGKINYKTILKGILQGKKKKDIGAECGSLAESIPAKINAVTQAMNTNKYKRMSKNLIEKLDQEVERLIESMLLTELNTVEYKDKSQSIERLKKLSELLKGGNTDRIAINSDELRDFLDRA